jgi:hypothetical protein
MSKPLPSCMATMSRIAARIADTACQALLFLMLGMPVAWASGVSISNLTITTFKQIAFAEAEISIGQGDRITRTATTRHSNGTVSYRSVNPAIATVDALTGEVTAVLDGETTIIATQAAQPPYRHATASYKLKVNGTPVTPTFTWSDQTVRLGNTLTLNDPTDSPNKLGAFSYVVNPDSAGRIIATVDNQTKVLTPSRVGSTTITVTQAAAGNYKDAHLTVTLTVDEAIAPNTPGEEAPLSPNTLALAPITKVTTDPAFMPAWTGAVGDPTSIQVSLNNPGSHVVAKLASDGRTIVLTGLAGEAEVVLTQPAQNGCQGTRVVASLTVKPAPFQITDFTDFEVDYILGRGAIPTKYSLPTDLAKPAGSTSDFIFTIDGYSSVASIEGNTLLVHRRGQATITATLPADELRHLEAKKQVTVYVEYYDPPPSGPVLGTGGVDIDLTPIRRRVLPVP